MHRNEETQRTHSYIRSRNSCWADIALFLMVLRDCTRWSLTFLLLFNVVCGECLYLNKRDTKKHKKRLLCDLVHGNDGYLRRTAMPSLANAMTQTVAILDKLTKRAHGSCKYTSTS